MKKKCIQECKNRDWEAYKEKHGNNGLGEMQRERKLLMGNNS